MTSSKQNTNMMILNEELIVLESYELTRNNIDERTLFMTFESFSDWAPKLFGEYNEYFIKMLFNYLSDGDDWAKVQISEFLI